MGRVKQTYNPCDDCQYSYSKNGQESGMCKICEFAYFRDRKQSEGEWIKQTKKTTSSVKGNEVEYYVNFCSECGYEIGSISYHHKFCQNCGARMKNAVWRDEAEGGGRM